MKYAIFILVHHNPWLINASLISLLLQTRQDYDLHFIYIRGDGEQRNKESYKEFYQIVNQENKGNIQLTPDDITIFNFIKNSKLNYTLHEVDNDHGLDSGAWYKVIKNKVWKKYEFCFFLMEGFLFTNKFSLESMLSLVKRKNIDFLSMGFEKRFLTYERMTEMYQHKKLSGIEKFHRKQLNYVLNLFNGDSSYTELLSKWPKKIKSGSIHSSKGRTEYHVCTDAYTIFNLIKYFFKRIIVDFKCLNIFMPKIFINNDGDLNLYNLSEIVSMNIQFKNNNFHNEESPFFFGCMCQHGFSNKYLTELSTKLHDEDIYNKIDVPFSATGLEPLWGIMPSYLGFSKWFTDAIHRPRKNYITLQREDNNERMCYYINKYYKSEISVKPNGNFIKILKNKINEQHFANILKLYP